MITSTLNKLLFHGINSEQEIEKSKQVLLDFMKKKSITKTSKTVCHFYLQAEDAFSIYRCQIAGDTLHGKIDDAPA